LALAYDPPAAETHNPAVSDEMPPLDPAELTFDTDGKVAAAPLLGVEGVEDGEEGD